jgi:hypothetical protein
VGRYEELYQAEEVEAIQAAPVTVATQAALMQAAAVMTSAVR